MDNRVIFGRVGTTMWLLIGEQDPSDASWASWLAAYTHGVKRDEVTELIVVSRGGVPKNHQRRGLCASAECDQIHERRTAVCSRSRTVRAATRAIGWFFGVPHLKNFGHDERRQALAYLRVPTERWGEILESLARFETGAQNKLHEDEQVRR